MDWYVLRTICGKEKIVLSIFKKIEELSGFEVFCPQRKIGWRKNGSILSIIRPLFEGYLFVSVSRESIKEFDTLLRMHKMNIAWLVRSAGCLVPIAKEEKQILQQLMDNENVVEVSKFERTENQFKIVEGPLLGLEPIITKISSRNHRITIEIPILHEKKKIELEGILVDPILNEEK